ncbi:DUF2515 domain-containing protein [bacterium LRH843]|nr:DUF2515 domain-containing protein [bacterium LRH843]
MKKLRRKPLPASLFGIKMDLKKALHPPPEQEKRLSEEEQRLLQDISFKTKQMNVNNVTRTMAYLDFYRFYPEIHWAFLGHMVSRNGGWNMTDLRGDLHSRLMNEKTKKIFFAFLERGNWLIFQDAYPQFLLYAKSMKQGRSFFHLLPYLNVSAFMEVMWNQFWKKRDSYTLAMAHIINEQNYVESRIVQHPAYKNKVFHTLEFVLQDLFSFNHILFPFHEGDKTLLTGLTLHHFGSLHERIMLGKRLYSLLFRNQKQWENIFHWAITHPHTGSRKDYWPFIFNDINEGMPGGIFQRRLKNCQLKKGASKIYSPRLEHAWKNIDHLPAEHGDWFTHLSVIDYLKKETNMINGEIVSEYCETLENLELVALAKKTLFI